MASSVDAGPGPALVTPAESNGRALDLLEMQPKDSEVFDAIARAPQGATAEFLIAHLRMSHRRRALGSALADMLARGVLTVTRDPDGVVIYEAAEGRADR